MAIDRIRSTLAAMTDDALAALRVAAEEAPTGVASGLMATIVHCADWELHRRRGIDFVLSGPQEAIEPRDMAESLTALAVFGAAFHDNPRIVALLDAIGEALRAPRPTVQ